MSDYVLLVLSIIVATASGLILRAANPTKGGCVAEFNFISAVVWAVLIWGFALWRDKGAFTAAEMIFGVLFGVLQAAFACFKTEAFSRGPASVTTLFGNCSILITTAVCVFVFGDAVSVFDILGIALLYAGVFLAVYEKSGRDAFGRHWIAFAASYFVCAAGVGVLLKCYGKYTGACASHMMAVGATVMAVFTAILVFIKKGKRLSDFCKSRSMLGFALSAGVCCCVYNTANVRLSARLPGTLFFPVFNGGVIVLSALLAAVLLKERLKPRQYIGLFIGLGGVITVGIL